jgi:hypothetical protein
LPKVQVSIVRKSWNMNLPQALATPTHPSYFPTFLQRSAGISGGTAYLHRSSISGLGEECFVRYYQFSCQTDDRNAVIENLKANSPWIQKLTTCSHREYHSIGSVENRDHGLSKTPSTSLPQFIVIRSSKKMGNFNSMFSGRHREE